MSLRPIRWLCCVLLSAMLAACGGVPLKALPRLMQLPGQLQNANPAEFMVALQVDARLSPPPGAVPLLVVRLTPKTPGTMETIDKKLPLQLTVASAATLGLDAPERGRRWLLYSLPPATQVELQRIQHLLRQSKADPAHSGGTLSLGVEQDSLAHAVTDPVLARSRWDTWLQTQRANGFFEIWSGTIEDIQRQAARNR